jgi:putative copper export protein
MDDPILTRWLAAARAVHFACCLLIAGVWVFDRLVMPRALAVRRRPAIGLLAVATLLAGLSGIAWFFLVAADMGDESLATVIRDHVTLRLVWSQTRFGRTWQLHSAFWTVGIAAGAVWRTRSARLAAPRCVLAQGSASDGRPRFPARVRSGARLNIDDDPMEPERAIALVAGLGLVGSLAWAGHGDTGPDPTWHLTADVLHLLATTVWPAGLVPFLLVLVRVGRSDDPDRWTVLHRITRRFSAASVAAVALLVLTGAVNSWCLLGSVGALFSTPYGRVLAVKLVLFIVMFGIGAVNLLRLKPRVATGSVVARRLRVNVTIEIVLGTFIVALVGLLGLLEPARQ